MQGLAVASGDMTHRVVDRGPAGRMLETRVKAAERTSSVECGQRGEQSPEDIVVVGVDRFHFAVVAEGGYVCEKHLKD